MEEWCICGRRATESHHIMFRSQMKSLEHCKFNQVPLCQGCHRGTNGVHGRLGHVLDQELKLRFQNKLELLFGREYFSKNEVKHILEISEKATDRLLKAIQHNKGFAREDIIRACLNGKMILEVKNEPTTNNRTNTSS